MATDTPLRVLMLEDRRDDVDLTLHILRREGFAPECRVVDTAADYRAALSADLDVIVADYSLPQFTALDALELLRESGLDVPFIVVTRTVGEEPAVECVRRGAADYLLKEGLARLGGAVRRTLEERRLREEKRRTEAALLESETRFRRFAENAQDIIFRYQTSDPPGFEYLNPAVVGFTGYSPQDFYADPSLIHRIVHPDDRARFRHALSEASLSTVRIHRRDGTMLWFEMRTVEALDARKRLVAIEGIARDVTERMRTEQVLHASQQWMTAIFEVSRDGIVVEADDRIVFANGAFARMLGYGSPQELLGRPLSMMEAPGAPQSISQLNARRLASEQVPSICEFHGRRKDGTLVELEATVSAATISGDTYKFANVRDVSERARLEEQLRQAQKMEAVGRLAGGIAHDFNNLLTAILGYTDLVRDRLPADSEDAKDLEEVQRASESAAALIRQLLAFGRKQVLQRVRLDLNAVLRGIRNMLARMVGEHVELSLDLAGNLPTTLADPSQLEQVVMNLVLNARDAMAKGGRITIATAAATIDAAHPAGIVPAGSYAVLSVCDTGEGMTPDVQGHLFEPFFTTKEQGKGTGLGLATVYGIVTQSGGWILVDSQVDRGTRFTLYFPAVAEPAESWQRPAPAGPLRASANERILIVEDEELVRLFARRVLAHAGYRVVEAVNGEQALTLLQTGDEAVDLVLTDVVMPGMSGRALVQRIAALRPEARVIYMSGYTGQTLEQEWFDPRWPLLTKPFTAAGLVSAVRAALECRETVGEKANLETAT
jgi:PAS domain S-box-containing protein